MVLLLWIQAFQTMTSSNHHKEWIGQSFILMPSQKNGSECQWSLARLFESPVMLMQITRMTI
jgi:hypothetical protein